MHISILLMEQIVELFIMILMGFIIVKAGIVKDEESKVLSKIVLYLIIPCVIIDSKWVVACFGGICCITDCIAWSYISYGEIVSPE